MEDDERGRRAKQGRTEGGTKAGKQADRQASEERRSGQSWRDQCANSGPRENDEGSSEKSLRGERLATSLRKMSRRKEILKKHSKRRTQQAVEVFACVVRPSHSE